MKKLLPLMWVFMFVLVFDCISMRYRISALEDICSIKDDIINRDRRYIKTVDSLIQKQDILIDELLDTIYGKD